MEIEPGFIAAIARDAVPANLGTLVNVHRRYVGEPPASEETATGWWVVQSQGPLYAPDDTRDRATGSAVLTRAGDTFIIHETNLLPLKSGPHGSVMRWQPRRSAPQQGAPQAVVAKRSRKPKPEPQHGM